VSMQIYPLIKVCVDGRPSAYRPQPLAAESTCPCPDRNELQPIAHAKQRDHTGTRITTWLACHTCGGQEVWRTHLKPGKDPRNVQRRPRGSRASA
jgi:hypothetical protein